MEADQTTGFGPVLAKAQARRRLPIPAIRRALREEAGLSQEDIAAGFEPPVHRETVSRWERGERTPRGKRLEEYCDLLDRLKEMA